MTEPNKIVQDQTTQQQPENGPKTKRSGKARAWSNFLAGFGMLAIWLTWHNLEKIRQYLSDLLS